MRPLTRVAVSLPFAMLVTAIFWIAEPAAAQDKGAQGYEPPVTGAPMPSRQEAAEMGDQRQREVLRGPFRNDRERTRGRDDIDADGFEQPRFDDDD